MTIATLRIRPARLGQDLSLNLSTSPAPPATEQQQCWGAPSNRDAATYNSPSGAGR